MNTVIDECFIKSLIDKLVMFPNKYSKIFRIFLKQS